MQNFAPCYARKCAQCIQAKRSSNLYGIIRWFPRICTSNSCVERDIRVIARLLDLCFSQMLINGTWIFWENRQTHLSLSAHVQNKGCQLPNLTSPEHTVPKKFSHNAMRLFTLLFSLQSYTGVSLLGRLEGWELRGRECLRSRTIMSIVLRWENWSEPQDRIILKSMVKILRARKNNWVLYSLVQV